MSATGHAATPSPHLHAIIQAGRVMEVGTRVFVAGLALLFFGMTYSFLLPAGVGCIVVGAIVFQYGRSIHPGRGQGGGRR